MTNPEYIGPRPLEELTIDEFARAELAHALTAPAELTDINFIPTATSSPAVATYTHNRNVFFVGAGEGQKPAYDIDGLTSLTARALGRNPSLLQSVALELSTTEGTSPINVPVLLTAIKRTRVFRSQEALRIHNLHQKTARQLLHERMHKAGHAAEPVNPYSFDELSAVTQNNQGYWIAHFDYEGANRFA